MGNENKGGKIMDTRRRQPIGIELVKRGILTEDQIQTALDYQKAHPKEKLGDIIHTLKLCNDYQLLNAIGEIFGEKTMMITAQDVKVQMEDYVSLDVLRKNNAVLFDIEEGRAKVCFADTTNKRRCNS